MKTPISIILTFLLISTTFLFTDFTLLLSNEINQDIATALSSGDFEKLAKYFSTTVDLTVPGNEGTFSKDQAKLIIKDFFTKNRPKSFKINNQGSSKGGAQFSIGTLITDNGKFRTYFLINKISDKYYIQQLLFEKEL